MYGLLNEVYYGNTVRDYLIAAGIIFGSIFILRLFKRTLLRRLISWSAKTKTNVDNLLIGAIDKFALPILTFLSIYIGISYLELSVRADRVLKVSIAVVVTYFILRLASTSAEHVLKSYVRRQPAGEEKVKQLTGVMILVNIVIWCLGFIVLFDNLGYNVTTIIAGLGIGGIAVALAAQNILGDLFNYFVIFFDRPFEVGDFIVLDDKNGTIEYIGIKTTRIKTLSGEQLIVSNSDLTKSRVHNFKRMATRRIVFAIKVLFESTEEQLADIPDVVRAIINAEEKAVLDRVHLSAITDAGIMYETVYIVQDADYNVYMDIQQRIYLKLIEEFRKRDIQFATPLQRVYYRSSQDKQQIPPLTEAD